MIELTNRELASVIIVAVFIGMFALTPQLRRHVGSSFIDMLRMFFVWKIQLLLFLYFAYALALVFVARKLGAWEWGLLKDTLIIVIFIGVPLLFSIDKVKDRTKFVREVARDVAGVSALVIFYLNLGSLPLWGELLLQPFIILLSVVAVVAHYQPEHRAVGKLAETVLGIIGFSLLAYTTKLVISTWNGDTLSNAIASFTLSVWLPIALIPFVYIFVFIMLSETILTTLTFVNDKKKPKLRVRIACIWGLHFSTQLASDFTGRWRGQLARSTGFCETHRTMKDFRQAVRARTHALKAYEARLKKMAGVDGIDKDGLKLDRREFSATKQVLTNLYFMQKEWHRNQGGTYRPELIDVLGDLTKKGLPEEHGIHLVVRKDRQAWRAWRQTEGGWYFAVGGSSILEHQWQYDGASPPKSFPSKHAPGWVNATTSESSIEWGNSDEIPARV